MKGEGGPNLNRGHQFFYAAWSVSAIQPIHIGAKIRRVWSTQLGNVDCYESCPDQSRRSHIGHRAKQSPLVTTVSEDKELEYCSLMAIVKAVSVGGRRGSSGYSQRGTCVIAVRCFLDGLKRDRRGTAHHQYSSESSVMAENVISPKSRM